MRKLRLNTLCRPAMRAISAVLAVSLAAQIVLPAYAQDAVVQSTDRTQETVFWQSVDKGNSAAEYQAYLDAYPNGAFTALARARIATLQKAGETKSAGAQDGPKAVGEVKSGQDSARAIEIKGAEDAKPIADFKPNAMLPTVPSAPLPVVDGPSAAVDRSAEELTLWQAAESKKTPEAYQDYLRTFPNGLYSVMAKSRVDELAAIASRDAVPACCASGKNLPMPVDLDALRADIGTLDSEAALGLNPERRLEVQKRLKALRLYAGRVDGDLGPNVRQAMIAWQKSHQIAATGYLSKIQLDQLHVDSEDAYAHLSVPPVVIAPGHVAVVVPQGIYAAPRPYYVAPAPRVYYRHGAYGPSVGAAVTGLGLGLLMGARFGRHHGGHGGSPFKGLFGF